MMIFWLARRVCFAPEMVNGRVLTPSLKETFNRTKNGRTSSFMKILQTHGMTISVSRVKLSEETG